MNNIIYAVNTPYFVQHEIVISMQTSKRHQSHLPQSAKSFTRFEVNSKVLKLKHLNVDIIDNYRIIWYICKVKTTMHNILFCIYSQCRAVFRQRGALGADLPAGPLIPQWHSDRLDMWPHCITNCKIDLSLYGEPEISLVFIKNWALYFGSPNILYTF